MRTSIYCGEPHDDPNDLSQSGAVLMHLMKDFLDKGYQLYADNYYNSVKLFDQLGKEEYTKNCVKKIGQQCVETQCENISVCKWKDRRDVYTISNMHRVVMVPTTNQKGYDKMKPNTE